MRFLCCALLAAPALAQEPIHTTYFWHLHQPIYWPDARQDGFEDEYEVGWESLQAIWSGAAHPEDDVQGIFSKDDRVAVYQWRVRDAIQQLLGHPDAGAQVNYSGALAENVASFGGAFQLGYGPGWSQPLGEAHGWTTSGGHSRADLVNFAHHHALLPLHSERTQWLQIRLHQERLLQVWGIQPGEARGFFPSETAFSERMIPVLEDLGVAWVFVSNEHLSRACPDFPVTLGSGGVMCDPPNPADQINPPGAPYWSKFIDRGCSPTNAVPFAYTPHRAQHVDPATGAVSQVIVVPTAQALSWDDGYSAQGANALDGIAGGNDPNRPMLVVLAHDGDNAWGGGFTYYMEAVPNFVGSAVAAGHRPSTVEQYLANHPVPADDLVHVEDGAWVNADSDFGSPVFTNWLYPLLGADGAIDPVGGWHNKAREYAIFTAAENRIRSAEDAAGGPATTRIEQLLDPGPATSPVERAWSYYLAGMDSGNVYYGNPLDMEVKGTVACNEAFQEVDPLLAAPGFVDATTPTVFPPQRHPYNPGGSNFGAPWGYQEATNDGSFTVWTFAYDVSGLASATLYWREDLDGTNPLASTQNETYAGGSEVGAWNAVAMATRPFPSGNVYGWGGLEAYAFESPGHIAEHLSAQVPPRPETLLDYYVEVVDGAGHVERSDIFHVWIGDGTGAPTPGDDAVTIAPDPPEQGAVATLVYDATGRPLDGAAQVYAHTGFDDWQAGTVQHVPMAEQPDGTWSLPIAIPGGVGQLDCVFNDDPEGDGGTWDNNGGADWHFATVAGPAEPPVLAVSTEQLLLEEPVGTGALSASFDVQNLGGGELAWTARVVPPEGSGPVVVPGRGPSLATTLAPPPDVSWLRVRPGQGSSSGELDPVQVHVDASRLGLGEHAARIEVRAPATGAVAHVEVLLDLGAPPPPTPGATGVVPDPPPAGGTSTIWYVPAGGPLAAAGQVWCHWGVDGWAAGTVVDQPMVAVGDAWRLDVALPASAAELDFVFHDGQRVWDNNAGQDWIVSTVGAVAPPPTTTTVVPSPPQSGAPVTIWYASSGTPLDSAGAVSCHWGVDGWSAATIVTQAMTPHAGGMWSLDVVLPAGAFELDFVFTDGVGTWDNNDGSDWKFGVVP